MCLLVQCHVFRAIFESALRHRGIDHSCSHEPYLHGFKWKSRWGHDRDHGSAEIADVGLKSDARPTDVFYKYSVGLPSIRFRLEGLLDRGLP
jgi:hypothetical protein